MSNKTPGPGIEGPGLANVDMALIKIFPLPMREGMRVEVRGEFFDARHARAMVLVRQILFWSCRIPYSSASDVGGQPGT